MPKKIAERRYPGLSDAFDQIMSMCALKQRDIAWILKLPQSSISEWMSGKSEPSRGTFSLICEKFGVEPNALAYGSVDSCVIDGHAYGKQRPKTDDKDAPTSEEIEIGRWFTLLRNRWKPKPMPLFYSNMPVDQQNWSNYELNKTTIPAWVLIRAVRQYGNADDLRWLIQLTAQPAVGGPNLALVPKSEAEVMQTMGEVLEAYRSLRRKEDTGDVKE